MGGHWLGGLGIANVTAREWWLACVGRLDPCLCSDVRPCLPLHFWPVRCVAPGRRSVSCAGYLRRRQSRVPSSLFRPASATVVDDAGRTTKRVPRSTPLTSFGAAIVARGASLDLSGAAYPDGSGSSTLFARNKRSSLVAYDGRVSSRAVDPQGTTCLVRCRRR